MLDKQYPLYLANRPSQPNQSLEVLDKYTGEVATHVALADEACIEKAIDAATKASPVMANMAPYERQQILEQCVAEFEQRREQLALTLCIEAGKPIKDSRGEVDRLISTFKIAAEESVRFNGEMQTLEISARTKGYQGLFKRVPIGPCSFISPFNFPLNLTAHKIAPALAVGCPFILKPASMTPVSALLIGEVLAQTALPEGAFSILPCHRDSARLFTNDERLKLLSFTGSPDAGWQLKQNAGRKKVVLELGGNAACIVEPDWDMDDAVQRILTGAFYQSGQSCISVQRILVHHSIYSTFREKLLAETRRLICGDPKKEQTFIGPMISPQEAQRLAEWIQAARNAGATLLCGGDCKGSMLEPSLLEGVPRELPLYAREAFGPVALLSPYDDFDAALTEVNDSAYGLHAGLFSRDTFKIQQAWRQLEVGGLVVGDAPSFRVDNMPYGGVKESGVGREGVRFAMEDMSEIRNLVLRFPC